MVDPWTAKAYIIRLDCGHQTMAIDPNPDGWYFCVLCDNLGSLNHIVRGVKEEGSDA